ncbi:hypothetical protein F4553_001684 [Allocatelliglobosispora scoriae]|uniref:Uncharacterized protein n=1 Tax=Allocatelliglobosispora scoriae TaxID=643052 RepID=A0A841BKY9_9ACTN|nr:hypothetical protein [Allocatelliglobosispora scoriae]
MTVEEPLTGGNASAGVVRVGDTVRRPAGPWTYALHGFLPLSADPAWQRGDDDARLRIFVDAYGLDEAQRRLLVPMLARRTRSMHDFLAAGAASDVEPWARLWREGHGAVWLADAEYIAARPQRWLAALLD